ncbi:hypothetical protein EBZ37_05175 [bacterium]|nr:hypothetical protein [bacterium]
MFALASAVQSVLTMLQLVLGLVMVPYEGQPIDPLSPEKGYVCQDPTWVKKPQLKGGATYLTSMSSECVVYPQLGGDLEKLQAFSIEQLKQRARIDRGPVDTTFEGLPSKYLEVTAIVKGKDTVTVTQDVNLATDKTSRMISSSVSKKIVGTGYGQYLKKIDTRSELSKTADPAADRVVITFYAEVDKPWFAPADFFVSEAEKRVPGEFAKVRNQVLSEMSKNY